MKGKWLLNIPKRVLDGSLTLSEALGFVSWRISKPPTLVIEGTRFDSVDPLLWGLITEIFINREYSPPGFEIGPDDVVVDIGSHRGVFAAFAARRTTGPILAIEPDMVSYAALEQLIEINHLDNVVPLQAAVSEASGEARLFTSIASSRHTLVGVDQATGEELHDSIQVRTKSLEEVLAPHSIVHFLKMDCEGAEYGIMDATEDGVLAKIERLVMEVHGLDQQERFVPLRERFDSFFAHVSLRRISETMGILYARRELV